MAALLAVQLLCLLPSPAFACTGPASVCGTESAGSFALIRDGRPAALLVEPDADPAVRHAADSFAGDLERVGGQAPRRLASHEGARGDLIIVGNPGRSAAIDGLIRAGKINAADLEGQWEAFRQIVVDRPFPNVPRALVIIGSDRRGAVFGLYDISEKIGVSPWHWFADVPVRRQANFFVTAGARRDQPRVRYRGFFINDEAPAMTSWAQQQFGGFNARMYARVFELLLRLKGNYLWPAMWEPRAFNADDPRNMVLADEMGVVMGTSHHEPMTRAHNEWRRDTGSGVTGGPWNYGTNDANLRTFWRGGIERMMSRGDGRPYESLVTVGMRGDGDEAMSEDAAIPLLERVVADQRAIIADVTGRPANQIPQVWALYKEVQDYYDRGMRVPDDVILLFADDNWGQIRRLPDHGAAPRSGGYGVYYHFDYVGGPRNYKWLNTNQIEKVWQQMDLAWQRGARSLWIVNVGDIKPVEFPLSFFMAQAWNPEAMTPEAMARYPAQWASATFGPDQAEAIGALVTRYSQYAARRKPELIDPDSFMLGEGSRDLLDGGAFGAMIAEWDALEAEAARVKARLPASHHGAYFQLVEHPIRALANLYRLYYAVAWNRRLAAAGDPRANHFADQAEAAFRRDAGIMAEYHALNGGKWDGMMLQTHIGYTTWQQPERQVMPEVRRLETSEPPPPIRFRPLTAGDLDRIVIEALAFTRAVGGQGLRWKIIPNLGHTRGAVVALPQGRRPTTQQDNIRLDYEITTARAGDLALLLHLAPTLDVDGGASLRLGVSIDDGPMQILTDHQRDAPTGVTTEAQRNWTRAVIDNLRVLEARFPNVSAGRHTIRIWRLDDNVVLQRLVITGVGGR